jgi:phospholipid/cholesterol/gamma-HCH transport system substrate-binding protein
VRGAHNAPGPKGPKETGPVREGDAGGSGGDSPRSTTTVSGYDPATGLALGEDGRPLILGSTGGQQRLLGEQAWKALLLGPLAG